MRIQAGQIVRYIGEEFSKIERVLGGATVKKLTRLAHIMALMSVTSQPLPKRNTDVPIVFLDDLLPPQATLQHNARKNRKTKGKKK